MSLEGQQLARYRIMRLLGSGGMGEVYLAEDPRIEQQVAIKVIRAEVSPYPNTQSSQEAARLFQREARAIVKLDHPHILPLYDYGEERLGSMTVVYLVMPYRREGSLADWLRQRDQAGLLAPQEVAHFVRQAASALQHAHDRQIIHQDVKPSNFLLRYHQETSARLDLPDLFLADFGIARLSTATASASQSIRGTPTYMAPEQWEGHPVPATDQYALAVMAYELLTGRPPFQGAPGPLMYQHLMAPPPPASTFHPRLSADIDAVLLHALAKKPGERFASVTAFATAFQQAVQGMPTAQTPTPLTAAPTSPATSDIHAVLAISPAEAQTGTTRTLTLPGGRQVRVPIPADARDGQIIRLEGQGEDSPAGGEAGALILTILVSSGEVSPSLSTASAISTEETLLTAEPTALATSTPTVSDISQPEPGIQTRTETAATEVARPAQKETLPPTELALPGQPSPERSEVTTSPGRPEQRADAVPAARSSQLAATVAAQHPPLTAGRPATTLQPGQRGISRRTVVLGLAGLAAVGVAGGGLLLLARPQQSTISSGLTSPTSPPRLVSTPDPTPTPLSIGAVLYTYHGHTDQVYGVAWSPNSKRIASCSLDKTVQVWDAVNGSHVYVYRRHTNHVFSLAWAPDGRYIGSAGGQAVGNPGDDTVQVWEATTGSRVFTYRGHSDVVSAVAWAPDSRRVASGGADQTVQVWEGTNGSLITTYLGHHTNGPVGVHAVAWSPDGRHIASGAGDQTVQVWDATSGNTIYIYRGHFAAGSFGVEAVAWSPDGKRIASAGFNQGTVQVWDATTGSNVFTYRGHSGDVLTVAWSPDGKRIASGSEDNTVQVWNAADGSNAYTYRGHTGLVKKVAWSPDGRHIASGSFDNTVQVWVAQV